MNLRWVPSPNSMSPAYAATLNSIFFPSTFVTSARQPLSNFKIWGNKKNYLFKFIYFKIDL